MLASVDSAQPHVVELGGEAFGLPSSVMAVSKVKAGGVPPAFHTFSRMYG